ncbi:MarR family winged helix-turn-helix transcriptional regulator [Roseibium sp. RKSG952]|uniref:MarR family winged helix-turn-helix transcriptional regulator n=1 Tax=Roseibium sp. RKSG952 TaxID=2529384 RepID=UPI0012BBE129|nr:MarR family transcriptional regulator [Roseibium sp. RKSG952]MTH95909.1 MarR family transcriptional regulator [Roseibium sp. RKSG952]
MQELDRKLGTLLSDVARFRRILFDQLASEYGLTHVQVFVLNNLHRQDGLTQTELSARMDIGTVTVSGLVDRLEAKGYVERRPDENDRRAKRVWLTPRMQDMWKKIGDSLHQLNEVTFDGVEEAELDQMVTTLRKARKNLQNRLNGKDT